MKTQTLYYALRKVTERLETYTESQAWDTEDSEALKLGYETLREMEKTKKLRPFIVEYYMRDAATQTEECETREEADYFMEQLNADPQCTGYNLTAPVEMKIVACHKPQEINDNVKVNEPEPEESNDQEHDYDTREAEARFRDRQDGIYK